MLQKLSLYISSAIDRKKNLLLDHSIFYKKHCEDKLSTTDRLQNMTFTENTESLLELYFLNMVIGQNNNKKKQIVLRTFS